MWWFAGLLGMLVGFAATLVLFITALATPSPYRSVFIKVFGIMLAVEVLLLIGAVCFIVLAETGRI